MIINKEDKTKLERDFYFQTPELVAKLLIGKILVRKFEVSILSCRITETEAYLSRGDLASHSASGMTKRNKSMYADGGTLYVYKIFGIHHCINVVTEPAGIGSAVLIRAAIPLDGTDIMKVNRNSDILETLCKGPGNLAKAFGFTVLEDGLSLLSEELYIFDDGTQEEDIQISKRIGITKSAELPLRFYIPNSKYVSGKFLKYR